MTVHVFVPSAKCLSELFMIGREQIIAGIFIAHFHHLLFVIYILVAIAEFI